ncbi:hypothetical protein CsatB_001760 [Cannabis sativa]
MAKVQIVSVVLLVGILISSFGFNGTLGQDSPMLLACCKSTKRPDLCPHSDSNPTKCDAECKKGPCRGGICKNEVLGLKLKNMVLRRMVKLVQVVSVVLLVGILISSFASMVHLGEDSLLRCCKSTYRLVLCPYPNSNFTKCNDECKKHHCRGGGCFHENGPVCLCSC